MSAAAIPGVIQWGDLPVPYVAAWSSESVPYVDRDPVIQHRSAIHRHGRRGDGRPIFGRMDERRTRRVVIERRCQVCAKELRGAGYVIDVPYARTGEGRPLVHEPPACEPCFYAAVALCPGIARLERARRLLCARVRTYAPYAVTVTRVEGGTEEINAALDAWRGARRVVGYVRPALVDYDVLSFAQVRLEAQARAVA